MKILIIEDEILSQKELTFQLNALNISEIVHYISTVRESITWLTENSNKIDLIFMDIELSDGNCFEIFESVSINTPIIFLTAYSKHAIKAFKLNSIDYLLKPINPKELDFAINKFKTLTVGKINFNPDLYKEFYTKPKIEKAKRILIQTGDNFKYISLSEIAYFEANDKYTTVTTFKDQKHLVNDSLNNLEERLPQESFYRPNRKYIVNIKAIIKASKYFNSRLKLHIHPIPENEIIISRTNVKNFLTWMGN
ncbi:LytR/AlgR family response regulator transcription factor [Winogradskyella psychrotolerans]|uniref:LytR/AlgR family response regulator transcription factor n=1 Tax=Winogradskyella psychrotolerans TaxID=1344585 RepID=UPI001C071F64|nr:LytTR family DNA-binding domain-containing protein [Winogradskyella psychrotolerans]MBU2929588.1 LytTR family DNA-binding domain-containing protein [Winogradskyella psychrotolerans]